MAKSIEGHISTESFDDFLESEGMLAEAEDVAIKRVLAWQTGETTTTTTAPTQGSAG